MSIFVLSIGIFIIVAAMCQAEHQQDVNTRTRHIRLPRLYKIFCQSWSKPRPSEPDLVNGLRLRAQSANQNAVIQSTVSLPHIRTTPGGESPNQPKLRVAFSESDFCRIPEEMSCHTHDTKPKQMTPCDFNVTSEISNNTKEIDTGRVTIDSQNISCQSSSTRPISKQHCHPILLKAAQKHNKSKEAGSNNNTDTCLSVNQSSGINESCISCEPPMPNYPPPPLEISLSSIKSLELDMEVATYMCESPPIGPFNWPPKQLRPYQLLVSADIHQSFCEGAEM